MNVYELTGIIVFASVNIVLLMWMVTEIINIKKTINRINSCVDRDSSRLSIIVERVSQMESCVKPLKGLADSLDAKENFVEGLNYGKFREVDE